MIIGIIAAMFAGCGGSSLDQAINQVEKALAKVEKNKGNMTEADWKTLEREVEEPLKVIAHALETNKVGVMERIKVMTLVAKWATVALEAGFTEIEKQTGIHRDEWSNEIEKSTRELEKALEGIDMSELEKAAKEMEKALEGIDVSELEKAAKEIEKALEGLNR